MPSMTAPAPEVQSLRRRLALPAALLLAVLCVGTLGYRMLWRDVGGTWLDALYMTVITVTTVGYREVHPLTDAGRLFTIIVAVSGVGTLFFVAGATMEYLVASQIGNIRGRRKMLKRIEDLENHVIVAGLGRVGRQAAQELHEAGTPFVIIDPAEALETSATERGFNFLRGDATADETLRRAGISRARGLIVTTSNDATNMYIVLSARVLNPKLFIVSRAVDEASVVKLTRAGANRAISPYAIGGRRLAHLILSPTVVDFFETAMRHGNEALNIEEIAIGSESPVAGRTLADVKIPQESGATLLAVLRDGTPVVGLRGSFELRANDYLLALGTRDQLERLERLAGVTR
jgi:voltage-gated potassium channel